MLDMISFSPLGNNVSVGHHPHLIAEEINANAEE